MDNYIWGIIIGIFVVLLLAVRHYFARLYAVVSTPLSSNDNSGMLYYYLPESVIKINATTQVRIKNGESSVVGQTFKLTEERIADTRVAFALKYVPNQWMNDNLTYTINENGLLETGKLTTEDRTSNVISTLMDLPKEVLKSSAEAVTDPTPGAQTVMDELKEFSAVFDIRAANITTNSEKKVPWVVSIQTENGVKFLDASFGIKMNANETKESGETNLNMKIYNGIVTRPLTQREFIISPDKELHNLSNQHHFLSIVDMEKMFCVPTKRSIFVERKNNLVFTKGIVTSNEIVKPSSVEGFVAIPVKIAKAIVSIPAQLLSFKLTQVKAQNELETARGKGEEILLKNEKAALKKQSELDNTLYELEKNQKQQESDWEKLKFELAKQQLDAKYAELEILKKFKKIQKEIEALK